MEQAELEQRVRWIEYKSQRILRVDLSHLVRSEGIPVLDREARLIGQGGGKALLLVVLTGGIANSEFMDHAKKLGKEVFVPNTKRQAMVGIKGIQAILLAAYNHFTGAGAKQKVFATEEEGKDWLVS
jgi:hypothetical protein